MENVKINLPAIDDVLLLFIGNIVSVKFVV
jgi:hypothetical protein